LNIYMYLSSPEYLIRVVCEANLRAAVEFIGTLMEQACS
jgi:hypothetical protein